MVSKMSRDLEKMIAEHEALLADIQEKLDAMRLVLALTQEREEKEAEESLPAKELRNEIWDVLNQAGEPLHYGEIYDRLRQRDVRVPGKDPKRNVNAHLSSDDRFSKTGGGVWGLRRWKEQPSFQSSQPATIPPRSNMTLIRERPDPSLTEPTFEEPRSLRDGSVPF